MEQHVELTVKEQDRAGASIALLDQVQGEQLIALLAITRSYIFKLIRHKKSFLACLDVNSMLSHKFSGEYFLALLFISLCGGLLLVMRNSMLYNMLYTITFSLERSATIHAHSHLKNRACALCADYF